MRISDWSSDVCSSDLALVFARWAGGASGAFGPERVVFDGTTVRSFSASDDDEILISAETVRRLGSYAAVLSHLAAAELEIPPFRIDGARSEERRVGKECVSTCRSRWSPDP